MQFNTKFFDELTNTELYNILKIRSRVFVVEQKCIYNDMEEGIPHVKMELIL